MPPFDTGPATTVVRRDRTLYDPLGILGHRTQVAEEAPVTAIVPATTAMIPAAAPTVHPLPTADATAQPITAAVPVVALPPRLAHARHILRLVARALRNSGLTGEVNAAKLLYLIVSSRVMDTIVSAAVKGPSSCGKSNLVKKVLDLFPKTAYYALSSMSNKALAYSKEPLEHRFLVIYEAAGMAGEMMTYMLRSLMSEGCIDYEYAESTSAGTVTRRVHRDGPTGLLTTTTMAALHAENETRFFSLGVTDTAEQTRAVLLGMASNRHSKIDLAPWHEYQKWLEGAEHRVVMPFAQKLAGLVSVKALRMRRDFPAIMRLIEIHAVLHQVRRDRDPDGCIIASRDDYEAVYNLVADLVAVGVQAAVDPTIRETVVAVKTLLAEMDADGDPVRTYVTKKDVARMLNIDKSNAGHRVYNAIDAGYLHTVGLPAGPGRVRVVLGDKLPDDEEAMPSPDRLFGTGCVVAA